MKWLQARLVALVLTTALWATSSPALVSRTKEALIGWQGDSYRQADVFGGGEWGGERPKSRSAERWVETLTWTPRAFQFHNFLTAEECDHILHTAAVEMRRSTVVAGNGSAVDQIRTSYGAFIPRLRDPTIFRIEQKLANWTQLPIVYQEDIQVLRYQKDQKYGAHYDSLNRVCTTLVFLTDTDAGGETAFPKTTDAHWADATQKAAATADGPFSACAEGHVAVKPRKGDALLFYSMHPNGVDTDPMAMHTGCPITEEWARKWTATFWIHGKPFRPDDLKDTRENPPPIVDAGVCADLHAKCMDWASTGECEKNPGYMGGSCRAACKRCIVCAPGDDVCYRKNREDDGYLNLGDEILHLTGRPLAQTKWIKVTFLDRDGSTVNVDAPIGQSLLEVAHRNDIDLEGACEGSLACSTCHVIVEDQAVFDRLPEADDDENDMLDLAFGLTETSRLGCQIIAAKDIEGIVVRIPDATRNFAVDGHRPKPH